jgi:hypothetical protein
MAYILSSVMVSCKVFDELILVLPSIIGHLPLKKMTDDKCEMIDDQ